MRRTFNNDKEHLLIHTCKGTGALAVYCRWPPGGRQTFDRSSDQIQGIGLGHVLTRPFLSHQAAASLCGFTALPQTQRTSSLLCRLLLPLLAPPLQLLQALLYVLHSLLVSSLPSQTESLLVDPHRLFQAAWPIRTSHYSLYLASDKSSPLLTCVHKDTSHVSQQDMLVRVLSTAAQFHSLLDQCQGLIMVTPQVQDGGQVAHQHQSLAGESTTAVSH